MISPLAAPAEPAATGSGPGPLSELEPALAIARERAGEGRTALILSGSHASGEAVWAVHDGRRVSLSDLDVYAVMPDAAARRSAERRSAGRPATRDAAIPAPIEVGWYTPDDLQRLPARPGTIELRRHGVVLDGSRSVLDLVPRWEGRDVTREEIARLIENRAYELLGATPVTSGAGALERLAARHAVLKTALDLATVTVLESAEYPDGAEARVARARALARRAAEPPWDEALAFRRSPAPARDADAEWLRTAIAWEDAWRRVVAGVAGGETLRNAARAAASRARWRRRLRHAVTFRPRARHAPAPGLALRLRYAAAGTPIDRLNASAAVLVLLRRRALESGGAAQAAERDDARDALADLGILDPARPIADATAAVLALWDGWVLDGRRFGGRA